MRRSYSKWKSNTHFSLQLRKNGTEKDMSMLEMKCNNEFAVNKNCLEGYFECSKVCITE